MSRSEKRGSDSRNGGRRTKKYSNSRERSGSPRQRSPSPRRRSRSPRRRSRSPRRRSRSPRRSPSRSLSPRGGQKNKVYIGNLSFKTREEDIEYEFQRYGRVNDIYLPLDRETGRPRGFGFVTFEDDRDAKEAVRDMDGRKLDGRELRVEVARAKPQNSGSRGGYGGGGGYGGYGGYGGRDSYD